MQWFLKASPLRILLQTSPYTPKFNANLASNCSTCEGGLDYIPTVLKIMNQITYLTSLIAIIAISNSLIAKDTLESITEAQAAEIVKAQEEAKEQAKDEREAELKSKEVLESYVVYQGEQRIIFNKIKAEKKTPSEQKVEVLSSEIAVAPTKGSDFFNADSKEQVNITLSGSVTPDGLSELWWTYKNEIYRVVSNADFSLFEGISEFNDEAARYSVFSLVTKSYSRAGESAESDLPSLKDFEPTSLGYIVIQEGSDPAAFRGLDAMLGFYAQNEDSMCVDYDKRRKINQARRTYLEKHPPKKRDLIINYTKD